MRRPVRHTVELYGLATVTGGLVAPALVHIATNSGTAVAAYRVLRQPPPALRSPAGTTQS